MINAVNLGDNRQTEIDTKSLQDLDLTNVWLEVVDPTEKRARSNKINLSIQSLTVVIFYLTIITTVTSFPNTVATFFGISRFGNTDTWIIIAAIALSTILPFIWLWRRHWLKYRSNL
jgi:Mg2+ and Co2+ transporter CorA